MRASPQNASVPTRRQLLNLPLAADWITQATALLQLRSHRVFAVTLASFTAWELTQAP